MIDSLKANPSSSNIDALQKQMDQLAAANEQLQNVNADQQEQITSLSSKLDEVMNKMSAMEASLSQCCSAFQSSDQSAISNLQSPILEQNVPNPFTLTSYIKFYIPSSTKDAMIIVSDANGSVKKQFTRLAPGFGTVNIEAGMLAAGTYQYTLLIDGKVIDTKQLVLTK